MYKALYRKYRPTNFNEITGQEIIVKTLINSIKNNKISHAYLFTGPRGTGKTSIAKILAKTVNCENVKNCIPCNECVCCTQTNFNTFTDIIEIDAASNNGVDEIRDIREKVNLVPSTGKYKIYIIDEVHMLSNSAFNALLKTLEEPPQHAIFILATTEPHKVLPTIISRCQRFDFKRIPEKKIYNRLKYIVEQEKISISDEALVEISKICDGGMRDAISLLDQVISYSSDSITIEDIHELNGSLSDEVLSGFVNDIINNDIPMILKKIDEFHYNGKNIIKITDEIIEYLKNVLLYKVSYNYLKSIKENCEKYKNSAELIEKDKLIDLIYKFSEAINKIKTSSDPKLAMEISIIKECISSEKALNNGSVNKVINNQKGLLDKAEENNIKNNTQKMIEVVEKNKKINNDKEKIINKNLEKLKDIRINNTLSKFDKKILKELKEMIYKVNDYLLDDKFSKYASIILDGEIKAASDKNIIFVYNTDNLSLEFNNNIINIEYFLGNIFDKDIKAISVNQKEWEIIKNEFNGKLKKYNYIEESKELLDNINNNLKEKNELDEIFGDIVKYE